MRAAAIAVAALFLQSCSQATAVSGYQLFPSESSPATEIYQEGYAYEHGISVPQDYRAALAAYVAAGERLGDGRALNNAGVLVARGQGHAQDLSSARDWFARAANAGSASGRFNYGLMAESGTGMSRDPETAVQMYRGAAEQGNPDAQYRLAMMLEKGDGVSSDASESQRLLRMAASRGHAEATAHLAKSGGSWSEASGSKLKVLDLLASETCDCDSGTPTASLQDEMETLRAGAAAGSPTAMYNLGVRLQNGIGSVRDASEAARLFTSAARMDYAPAQYAIGMMYMTGNSVPQDNIAAHAWMNLAARDGSATSARARTEISRLESQMTSDDVVLAQKQAAAWAAENRKN